MLEEREAEIANIRLTAIGQSPRLQLKKKSLTATSASDAVFGQRQAYMGIEHGFVDVPVYDGSRLEPGHAFSGPAIIDKPTTTIVLFPGQQAQIDAFENVIIDIG
jgi:N-methylhydantoinase A